MIPLAKPVLDGLETQYVNEALKSGWISNRGEFVPRFEREVALRHGSAFHGVSCSSGTAALHLALLAAGLKKGDQVLVPNLTFGATINVVIHCGLEPVLVDVDDYMCMDPGRMLQMLRQHRRIKAVMLVWLYGNEPDKALWVLAKEHKLIVIEDRAECTDFYPIYGHYACYSYYANKAITTGEGGMVVTRHPEAVRLYRDHGMTRPYFHMVPGLNYRMTNVAAAIGCAQMDKFDVLRDRRKINLALLKQRIPDGQGSWMYVAKRRDVSTCETRPIFDPLHTYPYISKGDLYPNAIRFHRDYFCLPCGPHLGPADIDLITRDYMECHAGIEGTITKPAPLTMRN